MTARRPSAFADQLAAVEQANKPAFKGDAAAAAARPPAARAAGAARSSTGTDWRTKSRPHRITVDLSAEEYDQLRAYRTADVNTSDVVRGCIALLRIHPDLVDEVRDLSQQPAGDQ